MMSDDGHFMVSHPNDRKATLELLQKIHSGDYYNDVINENNVNILKNLNTMCCKTWDSFINLFIQRGVLEYVELPEVNNVINCRCE